MSFNVSYSVGDATTYVGAAGKVLNNVLNFPERF